MSGWNYCGMVVGLPGDGKTTLLRSLIARHRAQHRTGIVLAHDPLRQFTRAGCEPVPDVATLRARLAAAGRDRAPVSPMWSVLGKREAGALVDFAMELGSRHNREDRVRLPILVPADEANLRGTGSGKTYMTPEDREFMVSRRHAGVGPIFNLQDLSDLVADFYRYSTDVYVFRLTRRRAQQLDEYMSLEPGTLEAAGVCRLPEHHYHHVRQRVGVIGDRL